LTFRDQPRDALVTMQVVGGGRLCLGRSTRSASAERRLGAQEVSDEPRVSGAYGLAGDRPETPLEVLERLLHRGEMEVVTTSSGEVLYILQSLASERAPVRVVSVGFTRVWRRASVGDLLALVVFVAPSVAVTRR